MHRLPRPLFVLVSLLLVVPLASVPAAAELYEITLADGKTFETRYAPQEATWDAGLVLFLTDGGNWIGIARDSITSVVSQTEFRGQGELIDATTIYMGEAPNDVVVEDDSQLTETERLIQMIERSNQPAAPYSTDQFVEPGSTGQGGVPLGYTQQYSPQLGPAPPIVAPIPPG